MGRKIIKAEESYKIENFEFKIFHAGKRGISQFVFKNFDNNEEALSQGEEKSQKTQKPEKDSLLQKKEKRCEDQQVKSIDIERIKLEARDEGYKDGYEKGLQEGLKRAEEFKKEYEAKKEDYLRILRDGVSKAVSSLEEIKKMVSTLDEDLPQLVLGYVKELVGYERKINDKMILSVFKKHIDKIKNVVDAVIYVNPKDLDIIKAEFPDYNFQPNDEVVPGGFKIKTNIGEFDFTVETILKNFEKTLNEEIETS
ncbi:FliH/SctL family protein [Deferribacter abyssi]|uniref:FliH/SctL family protein n=1 Tax=Deferribacter abyssi TaxID=213806 RepID=UPI003C23796C